MKQREEAHGQFVHSTEDKAELVCTDESRLMDRVVGAQGSSLDGFYFLNEIGSETIR